jgi:hypothetical protein
MEKRIANTTQENKEKMSRVRAGADTACVTASPPPPPHLAGQVRELPQGAPPLTAETQPPPSTQLQLLHVYRSTGGSL